MKYGKSCPRRAPKGTNAKRPDFPRPRGAAPHGTDGKPKIWDYQFGGWYEGSEKHTKISRGSSDEQVILQETAQEETLSDNTHVGTPNGLNDMLQGIRSQLSDEILSQTYTGTINDVLLYIQVLYDQSLQPDEYKKMQARVLMEQQQEQQAIASCTGSKRKSISRIGSSSRPSRLAMEVTHTNIQPNKRKRG